MDGEIHGDGVDGDGIRGDMLMRVGVLKGYPTPTPLKPPLALSPVARGHVAQRAWPCWRGGAPLAFAAAPAAAGSHPASTSASTHQALGSHRPSDPT